MLQMYDNKLVTILKRRLNRLSWESISESQWLPLVLAISIVIITAIFFSSIQNNGFVLWDDNIYVYENNDLNKPLPEAILYFFGPHYYVGNYHPLTMLVYSMLYHFSGADPDTFHITSLFIHLVNTLLVFWFAWLLSNRKLIIAAITSVFFGIHPMHVESVAWIAELKDVLYAFFFIAGLIAYLKYSMPDSSGRVQQTSTAGPLPPKKRVALLVVVFLLFVCSVLSKPAAVIFPVVLFVIDFYNGRKTGKSSFIEKIPFFIVAFIIGVITVKAQRADGLLHNYYPVSQRMLFASYSLLHYIIKLFAPVNLSNFYPYPAKVNGSLPIFFYIAPAFVLLIAYALYRSLKYTRVIVFGFMFFLVTIILELQLISVGEAMMSERYTYVPYIGLIFMLASVAAHAYYKSEQHLKPFRYLFAIFLIALIGTCGYLTDSRCKIWRSNDIITEDTYRKYPGSIIPIHNMAAILYRQGRFRESLSLFERSIHIMPGNTKEYINLANAYLAIGETDSAYGVIGTAMQYATNDFHSNYLEIGKDLILNANYLPAAKFLNRYCQLQKNDPYGYIALAGCYYSLKDSISYISTVDSGVKYCPDNASLLNHKGYSLFLARKYQEAILCFKKALESDPGYTKAAVNLDECYRELNIKKDRN